MYISNLYGRKSMNAVKLLAAALMLAGASAPAFADTAPVQAVEYRDLNLSTARGVARLDARLHRAVGQVCEMPDLRDLVAMAEYRKCHKIAVGSVAQQRTVVLAAQGASHQMAAAQH